MHLPLKPWKTVNGRRATSASERHRTVSRTRSDRHGGLVAMACLTALLTGLTTGCLNPDFVNQRTGNLIPTAPGDTPFLLVDVINNTSATVNFNFFVDEGAGIQAQSRIRNLTPQVRSRGRVFPWPVVSVGLGNANAPFEPALVATFPGGLTVQVPAGRTLFAGEDFFEGDTVIFLIEEDVRSPTFISVTAGRVDGSTQTGPFPRGDTFETMQLLLLRNGLLTLGG